MIISTELKLSTVVSQWIQSSVTLPEFDLPVVLLLIGEATEPNRIGYRSENLPDGLWQLANSTATFPMKNTWWRVLS